MIEVFDVKEIVPRAKILFLQVNLGKKGQELEERLTAWKRELPEISGPDSGEGK